MSNKKSWVVHCRYPKCNKIHETTLINKDDAIKYGKGNSYYHPDCLHIMQTINLIRDTFIHDVNPLSTRQQIGALVSIINNIVFTKAVDVDFLYFALNYFIKNKPGALKYPGGLHYIIQNEEVKAAWEKAKEWRIRSELKAKMEAESDNTEDIAELDLMGSNFSYKPQKERSFADILK